MKTKLNTRLLSAIFACLLSTHVSGQEIPILDGVSIDNCEAIVVPVIEWSQETDVQLSNSVFDDVCRSWQLNSRNYSIENAIDIDVINSVAGDIVFEYLDRVIQDDRIDRSIYSIIGSNFEKTAFSRPEIVRWGRVRILNNSNSDEFEINGERYPYRIVYVVSFGTTQLSGYRQSQQQCHEILEIDSPSEVLVQC
jgi:hypothetical protein